MAPASRPFLWLLPLLLLAVSTVVQGADRHSLWQVEGPRSTVYLLGSIHALRPADYPLAEPIQEAFRKADAVVLETTLAPEANGEALSGLVAGGGPGLAEQLGEERYRRARELAERHSIDLASLSDLDPWLAGVVIMQGALQRAGFRPGYGVDAHFQRRATKAGKPVLALETPREQLRLFDDLPSEVQGAFLLQTLEEVGELEARLDKMVRAWKAGRANELERLLLADLEGYPELYERLVVQRNRRWLGRMEGFAADRRDYLVVVGAAHLVGEQGLVALLRERGYSVTQQ